MTGPSPIIAILRGLETDECLDVADALLSHSISMIEVPLNSPQPFRTIERLAKLRGDRISLGAGTVLNVEQVRRLSDIGAQYVISPNLDRSVVEEALRLGLDVIPGVFTPTEIFAAINMGATRVKLFPISSLGVGYIKAVKAVLPDTVQLFPVGGVNASNITSFMAAGASGVGVGGDLFRPGDTPDAVMKKASLLHEALDQS